METFPSLSAFPLFTIVPKFHLTLHKPTTVELLRLHTRASINPPPSDFNFRTQILSSSQDTIAVNHPELLDLAENGTLVLIRKHQFGPVPSWRTEFVEPEEIWLVGTSHISSESAMDVDRVVKTLKPDNVVVELCRSRAGIMYIPNDGEGGQESQQLRSSMFSLSGAGFFGAIGRSLNLGGQTALALRLLLAFFSSKISSDVNRPFGDEFRAARKASEETGAHFVLGDRPIEITEASTGDSTFQLYEQLSFSYPSLLPPLIHERDTYLAWSLQRRKTVYSCKRLVGVIGKGHMNGVVYVLISDLGDLRFRDLVGSRNASGDSSSRWINIFLRDLVRDTAIGFIIYAVYEHISSRL